MEVLLLAIALKLARAVTGSGLRWFPFGIHFNGASLDAISVGGNRSFESPMGPLNAPEWEAYSTPITYRGIFEDNGG